jgi:hypothetical protein
MQAANHAPLSVLHFPRCTLLSRMSPGINLRGDSDTNLLAVPYSLFPDPCFYVE